MSGTKIFFIILVLVLIVFIAIEVVGVGKNNSKPSAGFTKCPGSPFCSLNSMGGSFGTKLDLKKKTFNLTQANPSISVLVPPDNDNSFREAAFKFQQGSNCATVSYKSNSVCNPDPPVPDCGSSSDDEPTKGSECNLKYQKWPCPNVKGKIYAVKNGGTLTIDLNSPATSCVVVLQ